MALGVPVVAHHVGGLTQLLRGGACGWPVQAQQAEAYAAALQAVFADADGAGRRCAAARAMVGERYGIGHCGNAYLDLYRRLSPALH
jgi:glycosyltransferase involved in cell wall biosynthesis